MNILKETIFSGRDNTIRLLLLEDGQLFHTAYPDVTPTRWVFTIHATTPLVADSDVDGSAFDWDEETSILELKLGSLFSGPLNYTEASLSVYSAEWPLGVVWVNPTCSPDRLQVRICNDS